MFQGVIPILHTPFREDGELDLESLGREVDFACAAGVEAMAFPGFASEWWKLSEDEIDRAAAVIRERSRGRARVIFNVTAQATVRAAAQARRFTELGADGLMCLPPFIVPAGQAALGAHLRAVMGASSLPHILQYSASLTGIRMTSAEIQDLHREFPHFGCVKIDYIPPGPMVTQLVNDLGTAEFTYLIGYSGLQLADSLRRGAHGLMGGVGHIAEDLHVFRALRRDPSGGLEWFHRLLPVLNFEMQTVDTTVAVHKQLLFEQGVFASPHVRQPGWMLDAAGREYLRELTAVARTVREAP